MSAPAVTDPDVTDPEVTEAKTEKKHLVDANGDKQLKANVTVRADQDFKFSGDGGKLLIVTRDFGEVMLLSAASGLPLHDTFFDCYNAWFSPDSEKIIVAGQPGEEGDRGLRVLDVASGADLIEPLPYKTGAPAKAVVFTSDGIVVAYLDGSYAEIQRLDFSLKSAPPLLADVAEAIAQHTLNDSGVLEAKCVTIAKLRQLGTKAGRSDSPSIFANWLKWFLTPAENRPVAPDSALTLAQYVEKYVEIASDASLVRPNFWRSATTSCWPSSRPDERKSLGKSTVTTTKIAERDR